MGQWDLNAAVHCRLCTDRWSAPPSSLIRCRCAVVCCGLSCCRGTESIAVKNSARSPAVTAGIACECDWETFSFSVGLGRMRTETEPASVLTMWIRFRGANDIVAWRLCS